jgi:spermidine synthase
MDSTNSIVIRELSDPNAVLEYSGTLLASNTNSLQSWSLLETNTNDQMLFINNKHQSSKNDEHIYHEMFVHSLMTGLSSVKNVLILGGSEGCMAREVLKWPTVEHIVQVDWDDSLLQYFKTKGIDWNNSVYADPRLEIICKDAVQWLYSTTEQFDAIFIDLLDPTDDEFLFFKELLTLSKNHLTPYGGLCINAGSVKEHSTTQACTMAKYMRSLFMESRFHHVATKVHVPSFEGTWCFLYVVPRLWSAIIHDKRLPENLKYFTKERFLKSMEWSEKYPSELKDYWLEIPLIVCKKLTPYFDTYSNRLISEYYGC